MDTDITFTVLHLDPRHSHPLVVGMVDAHDENHARMLFEEEFKDCTILGIYPGDVSVQKAMALHAA